MLKVRRLARSARAALLPSETAPMAIPSEGAIRRPGAYRLEQDLIGAGPASIEVAADDVVIDLNGHVVTAAPGSSDAQTYAIRAHNVANLTVRGGTVRGGWSGFQLFHLHGGMVHGVTIEGFDHIGLAASEAQGLRVADCRIRVRVKDIERREGERYAVGLNYAGTGLAVEACAIEIDYPHVAADAAPVETIGILVAASGEAAICRNRIVTARPLRGSYGIWGGEGSSLDVTGNRLVNLDYGVTVADAANARVDDNHFICDGPPAANGDPPCTAAVFARSADLREAGNRIAGYAAMVTRYRPDAVPEPTKEP